MAVPIAVGQLVVGTRSTTRTLGHVEWACSKCGRSTTQEAFVQMMKATLFWIPIMRLPSVYQLTCRTCGHTILLPKALKPQVDAWAHGRQLRQEPAGGQVAREGSALARPIEIGPPKNPVKALLLSALFPGLGHLYIGNTRKGFLLIGLQLVNALLAVVVVGFLTGFAVWVYGMIDAYKSAAQASMEATTEPM